MAATSDISIWATLVPVIVGGSIGVIGGLIGPPFLYWLQRRNEKKKKRAEKFEELVSVLFEHKHWLETLENARVYGDAYEPSVSPYARALAIASVYFPNFEKQLAELDLKADAYELWMLKANRKRLDGDVETLNEGSEEAFGAYSKTFLYLIADLRKFAKTEFQ